MTKNYMILPIILLLTLCLAACATEAESLEGQILLWHSWEGAPASALQNMLHDFRDLYPEVAITADFFPADEIEEAYLFQIEAGLGPDMVVVPADWVPRLNEARAIKDISGYQPDLEIYFSAAIETLREGEKVYGLPLSLSTSVLYYNKSLLQAAGSAPQSAEGAAPAVEAFGSSVTDTQTISALLQVLTQAAPAIEAESLLPPTDLDQILGQASSGQTLAMRSDFYGAFWGVQAFGGQLFDDSGHVMLNQGGFANWLNWLKKAQNNPNVILSRDQEDLQALFTAGKATYYIGSTDELLALQSALGADMLGGSRLPGRRDKPAGPFLQVEAMIFNSNSTRRSTELAIQLGQFLTNTEHQRQLVLSAGKLATNSQVNFDARIEPVVSELMAQSKTSVSVSLEEQDKFKDLVEKGDELYRQVLGGERSVVEAATLLTTQINQQYGLDTNRANQLDDCDVAGSITLWNTWSDASRDALIEIQNRFQKACADASLTIVDVSSVDLYDRYLDVFGTQDAPDLLIGNNDLIRRLASQEHLLNLSDSLEVDFFQQFIPTAEQAMLFEGGLMGIPISVNSMALYVNTSQVPDPPVSLDDLLVLASPDRQVAIPIGFRESYWGISAFGESSASPLLNEEGRLILGEFGLPEWLAWLDEAHRQSGLIMSSDRDELQTLFQDGRAALLVSDASQLSSLAANHRVLPLPSGSPLLEVDSLLFNPSTAAKEREVALKFGRFMSNVESQTLLMQQAQRIPPNINVKTVDYPAITAFVEQADSATVMPNVPQVNAVFDWGHLVYEQVLQYDIEPAIAVTGFTDVVDTSNGFELPLASAEEECREKGEITLWHSWNKIEEVIWQEVINNFAERCPDIQVTPTFVEASDFSEQLAASLEIANQSTAPDLFIAPHAEMESYQAQNVIQDITPLVHDRILVSYLPRTLGVVSAGERLYGLPQALHVPSLYYHPDLVESPATTFAALLEDAQEGKKVAMNSDFYTLFWGAAAFDCVPCYWGTLFNKQGELTLTRDDLAAWLAWLHAAKKTNRVIFDTDQALLEALFLEGEVAYLVADVSFLNQAQAELGVTKVGVASLTYGEEEQPPIPFITVDSFFFHSQATQEEVELSLKFAEFASSGSSQRLLRQKAHFLPTDHLAIITSDEADLAPFISQIYNTVLLPSPREREIIRQSNLFDIYQNLE